MMVALPLRMVSLVRSIGLLLPPSLRSVASAASADKRRRLAPQPRIFVDAGRRLCARSQMEGGEEAYAFGPYKINRSEVFYTTPLSFAMVNLRPVLPDVLVCPRREVKRFVDLSAEEISDLWLSAKEIGGRLEPYHEASSLTFTIQDGPQAGQTVPHVHIHIIPRKNGDFENNDEIYDAIDVKEKELKEKFDLDKERKDRTSKEMAEEAEKYRTLFS